MNNTDFNYFNLATGKEMKKQKKKIIKDYLQMYCI